MSDKEVLIRFGVSMPQPLIEQFDHMLAQQGYDNRSEAVRDLVRKALLEFQAEGDDPAVAGTIVMVYDHHKSELPQVLTELQHQYHHEIISTMHIHLTHHQCLENIVVRGPLRRLRELCERIQVLKGVEYAELSVTHIELSGDGGRFGHEEHHDHRHGD